MSFHTTVIEGIVYGFSLGMIFLMVALGLTLIFGLMDVVNFAHGALVTLGAYVGFSMYGTLGNFWLVLVILPFVVGIFGAGIERGLVKRLYSYNPILQVLLTFGIALVIEGAILIWFGQGSKAAQYSPFAAKPVVFGGIAIPQYRLFLIVFTTVLVVATLLVIRWTRLGLVIKAGIQDRERTQLLGIRISRINTLVFGVGAGFAALGGYLAGPILGVNPQLGTGLLITSFVIVIVGGLGDIRGAIISALLVGIFYNLALFFIPEVADATIFVLMITVLLIRPNGLLGEGTAA
jgi:branched-subunit amino acid ABC-type transport system permease component